MSNQNQEDEDMKPKLEVVPPPIPIEPIDEEYLSRVELGLAARADKPKRGRPRKKYVDLSKRALESGPPKKPLKKQIGDMAFEWQPTNKERHLVKVMIMGGIAAGKSMKEVLEDIAKIICPYGPISTSTVRRRFPEEIKHGELELKAALMAHAYDMAMSSKSPQMTLHFLKAVCGWRETDKSDKKGVEALTSEKVSEHMRKTAKLGLGTIPGPPEGEK